jgi:hypothetical protein
MRRLLVILLTLVASIAVSQDLRIGTSTGTAEIELPASGWLQAVSGRSVPVGSALSTWIDAEVTVVTGDLRVAIGELSVLLIDELDSNAVVLRLETGSIAVTTVDHTVQLVAGDVSIQTSSGTFSYADGTVVVSYGSVLVELNGRTRELSAPVRFPVSTPELAPLVQ